MLDIDHLERCREVAQDEICSHRNVGAVLVDKDGNEIGAGRNLGMPYSGKSTCASGACPRGLLPPGRGATDYSDCIAVHAEFFAIFSAARRGNVSAIAGATMYASSLPCSMCIKQCMAVGITRLVWLDDGIAMDRNIGGNEHE